MKETVLYSFFSEGRVLLAPLVLTGACSQKNNFNPAGCVVPDLCRVFYVTPSGPSERHSMTSLGLFALVITISAIFGIVNSKTLRLPFTIGILSISIIFSAALVLADKFVPWPVLQWVKETLERIDKPAVT